MDAESIMRTPEPYAAKHGAIRTSLLTRARTLCWELNQSAPDQTERRSQILRELFGTCGPRVFVEPSFRCDYGFNIHFHGFALVNYNCVILDTSPVHIGDGALIAPGVVISCAGHAIHPSQRAEGIGTSAPITLEDNVWIGANATVCAGVTIGQNSIIGAGSVVTADIPPNTVAAGVPCRPIRAITDSDLLERSTILQVGTNK